MHIPWKACLLAAALSPASFALAQSATPASVPVCVSLTLKKSVNSAKDQTFKASLAQTVTLPDGQFLPQGAEVEGAVSSLPGPDMLSVSNLPVGRSTSIHTGWVGANGTYTKTLGHSTTTMALPFLGRMVVSCDPHAPLYPGSAAARWPKNAQIFLRGHLLLLAQTAPPQPSAAP